MEKRSEGLAKNTVILMFGTICTKGIMFIMTPLFTRWLSQEDYGRFDLLINYVTLIIPIITLDIGEAVFRFLMDSNKKKSKNLITNATVANILGLFVSLCVCTVIYLISPQNSQMVICFFVVLLAETAYSFFNMVMRGLKHLTAFAIANIIYVVVMVISVVFLVRIKGLGLPGIFLGYATGYAVSALYMGIICKIHQYISISHLNLSVMKDMLAYSIHMIPNAVAWWLINVSDRTIVTLFLGSSFSAILSVSHKLPNLCQTLFSRFHLSWQQSASETINDKDRDVFFSSVLNTLLRLMSSLISILMVLNYIYFKILYTDEYFMGFYLMPIFLIAILVYIVGQFMGGIYIAQMKTKKNGYTTSIAAIVNLVVHLLLIKYIGIYASAISTLIAYSVLLLIRYLDIRKEIHLKISKPSLIGCCAVIYFAISGYCISKVFMIINIVICIFLCTTLNIDILKTTARTIQEHFKKKHNS